MVLRNTSAEDAYQEAVTKYNEALAKTMSATQCLESNPMG